MPQVSEGTIVRPRVSTIAGILLVVDSLSRTDAHQIIQNNRTILTVQKTGEQKVREGKQNAMEFATIAVVSLSFGQSAPRLAQVNLILMRKIPSGKTQVLLSQDVFDEGHKHEDTVK